MFIPFDMIAALLFIGYYAEKAPARPPGLAVSLLILAGAVAVALAASALINFVALRRLRRPGTSYPARRGIAGTAEGTARGLLVLLYVAAMLLSSFPHSAGAALGLTLRAEGFALQAFALAPFLLLFFAVWIPLYPLHKATAPGIWTRGGYVLHKARYNLYMLLAWLPFALLAEWLAEMLPLLPAVFFLAAWTFPILLAWAWGCRPLPPGDVMDTVRRLEVRAGVRFSRVYLWEPGGGGQNAAAVGVCRPFRFLFLTPALIRNMTPEELEAVILHELGHARKRHLLFYLFTTLTGVNAAILAAAFCPVGATERFFLTVLLVLGYFRFVFGFLSRNMERQADLFALETSGNCRGLANALEKLGLAAGGIRRAASWHHLGIAERVAFLRRAEREHGLIRRHNRSVTAIMLAGYLTAAGLVAGLVWALSQEYSAGQTADVSVAQTEEEAAAGRLAEAHWRRVMRVMPADATAPLELAYRLAGQPSRRAEAAELAAGAARLSRGREERRAAEVLLNSLKLPYSFSAGRHRGAAERQPKGTPDF